MDPFFKKKKYVVKDLVDKEYIHWATKYYDIKLNVEKSFKHGAKNDVVRPDSLVLGNDSLAYALLISLTPKMEEIVDKKLFPTYSYTRAYLDGQRLITHNDRPSCEYSITLPVCGPEWPLLIYQEKTWNEINITPGQGLIYKGQELPHRRKPLVEGGPIVQLHLHYVDAEGPHSEWKFDKGFREKAYAESTPFFTMSDRSEHISFS